MVSDWVAEGNCMKKIEKGRKVISEGWLDVEETEHRFRYRA